MVMQELQVKLENVEYNKCPVLTCPKVFLECNHLSTHVKQKHVFFTHAVSACVKLEMLKIFECDYCNKSYFSKYKLLLHRLNHVNKSIQHENEVNKSNGIVKPFKCSECNCEFVVESTLEAHAVFHQPFPYICYCGIGYYQQKDLQSHQKYVHAPVVLKIEYTPQNNSANESSKPNFKNLSQNRQIQIPKLKAELAFHMTPLSLSPLDVHFKKNDEDKYECPECTKILATKTSAEVHYRTIHRGERRFICQLCSKAFTQSCSLKVHHLAVHSGFKDHSCQYCNKRFSAYAARILHERIHTGEKPYICTSCNKAFSDPSAFARHQRIHSEDKRYRCDYCPKAFTDNSQLYIHRKRHLNEKNHRCEKCKKKYYTKADLRKHFEVIHERRYKFKCQYCFKDFSSKTNLQNHMETHRNTSYTQNYYECADCCKSYNSKGQLRIHIIKKHMNINCTICKRYFSSLSDFKEHRLKVRDQCDICEQVFVCKGQEQVHYNRMHNKRNTVHKYECDYCGSEFTEYFQIRNHILLNHSKHQYLCDHCGRRFALKINIRSHMRNHLELIRCNICYKNFYSRIDLQRHKKIPCTLISHSCKICNKSLTSLSSLRAHQLLHADNRKMYKCPICFQKLLSKSSVVYHMRVKHYKKRLMK